MDVKEKLVELIDRAHHNASCVIGYGGSDGEAIEEEVRYLLSYGVTVQECVFPEEDYYVLRNAETGMYFRGKGVNGWGKHFNQATIYRVKGTAERSIREVAWNGEKAQLVRIKIVEMPEPPKEEA